MHALLLSAAAMTTARSSALVFKSTHPNTAANVGAEHRVEMLSKQSKLHSDLEDKTAQLVATKVSAERTEHNLARLQGEVKRLRTASRTREKELIFYRNAAEESEGKRVDLEERVRKVETELHRARAETRTLATRPGAVTAARHERAQERLSVAAGHSQRLASELEAKGALVKTLEQEVAMLKREANLLAQALDVREAVGAGAVDGASIFVESAKLKEQVKAMALGAAEKSGEVSRLRRELEDTKITMAAQHAVELEAKTLECRQMSDELAQLRLERTAMLEHTANMAQRHTKKVTEGGDDRRRVLELQRKVETQTATIQSLLEMKKRLLAQMQARERADASSRSNQEGAAPLNLMGSLDQGQNAAAAASGRQQSESSGAADSFRTANASGAASGAADSESLQRALEKEKARADREARSVQAVRQELAGLHGDIGHLQQQLLEAQHTNMQHEREALSSMGEEQSGPMAQVSILEQENKELFERMQQMSAQVQQLTAQNMQLAQQRSGGSPP